MKLIACLIVITIISSSLAADYSRVAFDLVNNFRKHNGKPPLAWDQNLYNIISTHSKDMAAGRVPVGHQSFDKRVAAVPFSHGIVSENVAMVQGVTDPAKSAVDSWINSLGHRQNILSDTNVSAVAAAQSRDGKWFFTQMFVKKN